jgi:hypothetical protein
VEQLAGEFFLREVERCGGVHGYPFWGLSFLHARS